MNLKEKFTFFSSENGLKLKLKIIWKISKLIFARFTRSPYGKLSLALA